MLSVTLSKQLRFTGLALLGSLVVTRSWWYKAPGRYQLVSTSSIHYGTRILAVARSEASKKFNVR